MPPSCVSGVCGKVRCRLGAEAVASSLKSCDCSAPPGKLKCSTSLHAANNLNSATWATVFLSPYPQPECRVILVTCDEHRRG